MKLTSTRPLATWLAVGVLVAFGLGGIAGGTIAVRMVDANLQEQHITFGADTGREGQPVDNGLQAYRFQKVIKGHVTSALEPAGFSTYEEVSAAARASVTPAQPTGDPKLQGLRRTALDGNLLRGTLFSSFAWWVTGWVGIAAGAAFLLLAGLVLRITGKSEQHLFFPAHEMTGHDLTV
jgi:hypothetical protein